MIVCPPERLARAREAMTTAGIDALLITPGADLIYLTGYNATALERLTCLVLPSAGDPAIVVPTLERPAALASPIADLGIDVLAWNESDDAYAVVAKRLRTGPGAVVAVGDQMWTSTSQGLCAALGVPAPRLAGPILRELRMRKTPPEVAALRSAGAAIDRVHQRVHEWLRPRRTEAEVGRDIADAIIAEGHDRVDFVIVGSGPNGASPHHELSGRVIEAGDPVVIDIGGTTPEGYCSDSTRTYVAGGRPDDEFTEFYAVLRRAQDAACAAVRPGATCESVDAAAREIIDAGGYGEQFIHRTGHGIGMEVHEDPYIVAGNTLPLEPGMAFSVEPGIYLPGRYGARIEDILVCTETGGERLNRTDRALAVLPG